MNLLKNIMMLGFLILMGKPDAFAQNDGLYTPEMGKPVRPKVVNLFSEKREGYECQMVEFSVGKQERVNAYLLIPEGASKQNPHPALLLLHDHGARFDIGKEKLVKPIADRLPEQLDDHIAISSRQWVDKNFDGVYLADSLASLGYVVLVTDALYWGDRSSADAHRWSELTYGNQDDASYLSDRLLSKKALRDTVKALKDRVYEGQREQYERLQKRNIIWAEQMLRDDAASVNMLKSLPYVDEDRIGAFGFSMGAHRCWMLAAFCDDVRCGVALSWMTTLNREEEMKASDYSMAVMPMRKQMDFGDIGMFLAPKPMLFLNGDADHLFPKEESQKAFDKLHGHYEDAGSDALSTEFFPGGHHCGKEVQARIVDYFDLVLR